MTEPTNINLIALTADIVSAYVGNHSVDQSAVAALIGAVHGALAAASGGPLVPAAEPAVPVTKSVRDNHIVCLEDGMKFKSLKRHLGVHHGLTPNEYRKKWALPSDYPMVAPSYASVRSALAKKAGLGRKAKQDTQKAGRGRAPAVR